MTYPSSNPDDYPHQVEYPEHECQFLLDRMVEVGILEDGILRAYEYTICSQCPNTQIIRTDREARQPSR